MLLMEVDNLVSQQQFDVLTERTHEVEELHFESKFIGHKVLLERVWDRLMDDDVGIVGLYGMGGVGKTTLLMQINNKFIEIVGRFDIVIWVVVSIDTTTYKIQRDIGKKLGLRGEEWDRKNENQRAIDIFTILKRKQFVLLLDDIWGKVHLEAVGIPNSYRKNECKVVFTTRSKEVCERMKVDYSMEIPCLDFNDAWDLFQKKVGQSTLESQGDIRQLAIIVTKKCHGLPLALNVIGETMACKRTVQEWHHAINILTSSAIEFVGMENKILPIMKYSYDDLKEEQVKSCFLYCSLFPKDYPIQKKRLIEYWISEGFIDENVGMEKALNKGYEIIDTLLSACLLSEKAKDASIVSMHDVVREMALWILSDFGEHKDQCISQGAVGLRAVPKVKNRRVVRRMSLIENNIEEIVDGFEFPQLSTLLLQGNHNLWNISEEFFRDIPKLLVLDLSYNHNLHEIPKEISKLVSLRYLDLSFTRIQQLPVDLQELKNLIHLNLEHTRMLRNLNGISNLSCLRIFRLRESRVMLDTKLIKELEMLEHLEFVSINISPSLIGDQQFYDSRVAKCVQEVCIKELPTESVEILVFPAAMSKLRDIYIKNCEMLEITIKKSVWNKGPTNLCFSNLFSATIQQCDCLKDLTWLLFAPNLTHLYVGNSKQVESIISQEKAASVLEEEKTSTIVPFQELKCIHLSSLPILKSIYWSSLPFPRLEEIYIEMCPNLRKLPLDSQSEIKIEEFTIKCKEKWIKEVEWEDEATRLHFSPCFKEDIY